MEIEQPSDRAGVKRVAGRIQEEETGKGQDRIDVPTVMGLPGQCRHDFPRDSTP